MENWGIILHMESSLLNTDNIMSTKRKITQIVSHELAHRWFGNLVTLEWWNDLWLNEGFASCVEYLGLNHTHPEWPSLDFFKVQTCQSMIIDSFESSSARACRWCLGFASDHKRNNGYLDTAERLSSRSYKSC